MNDREQSDVSIFVAIAGQTAIVQVVGRASYLCGPDLKKFSITAMERGCTLFLFDMADCIGMDSAFMGVLAGIATRLRIVEDGRIVMLNLHIKTRDLLDTLGLSQLMECHVAGESVEDFDKILADLSGQHEKLDAGNHSELEQMETMLEAHQVLSDEIPENRPKFENVLEFLRHDLNRLKET